jgi:hypothetical protein
MGTNRLPSGDSLQASGAAVCGNDGVARWRAPCRGRGMAIEMILGRGLAFCCHPFAAWRVLPRSRRLLLAGAYFAASYVMTLLALMTL